MNAYASDVISLEPRLDLGRRAFAVTTLVAGFAAAVSPVAAATITTSEEGLTAGEVKVTVTDGEMPAYRAMPSIGGPFPTVLVVQEIFGVHEHIKDVCRRLAKNGYYAIAPELYARQGNVSGMTDIQQILSEVVSKVPDSQVMSDIDTTAAFAKASGQADIDRLGITGFCWGGRITWLYAAHNPQVKAGIAWYGRLVGDATPNNPQQPIDIAATLKAPVLGLYGGKDQGIPLETVEQMRSVLNNGSSGSEFVVYAEAGHAFYADYRSSYSEDAAKDAWKRCLAWFQASGVA
jgi:carboxymethylenebutenolidase